MSGQQTLIKIGAACAAIVLGSIVVGSQLGGNVANLAPKSAEEDEAAAIDSPEADDTGARNEEDEETEEVADEDEADDTEVAESADESASDEAADEGEVAADEAEGDEEADEVAADESPAADDEASNEDEASAEDDAAADGDQQQADAGSGNDQDGDVIYNGLPAEPSDE
jgi:hypothetical protein